MSVERPKLRPGSVHDPAELKARSSDDHDDAWVPKVRYLDAWIAGLPRVSLRS